MSQYPNNYNPYGQNQPDPQPNQGTVYGSPAQGQGQNPYPGQPGGPGTNPNPYGPYSGSPSNPDYGAYNPYNPNPPTPAPPYNPYDANAPTVASQSAAPIYQPYQGGLPPVPSMPPAPRRRSNARLFIFGGIALLVIVAAIVISFAAYSNSQQGNKNATATAQANTSATQAAQATANAIQTATAVANTYPFSANRVMNDPLTDNSKGSNWQTDDLCKFSGNAYHVTDSQKDTFSTCFAQNTDFSNFTFQVDAQLLKGDGLGILFRGNATNNTFYRFTAYSDNSYYVYMYNNGSNTKTLKSGNLPSSFSFSGKNTLAVVARGTSITIYMNQTQLAQFTDSTYSRGQIGLSSTNLGNAADVVFSNVQVWSLV